MVFLDFNLDLGIHRIEMFPDFLGYLFVVIGVTELLEKSGWFVKAKPIATAMTVYSGIIYTMDVIGISNSLGALGGGVLGIISTVASLYLAYCIVMGIVDIERTEARQMNVDRLYQSWKLLAVISVVTYALIWIPGVNIISMIFNFIIYINFLYMLNITKNKFYA